jgi:hypothetical protein
MEQPAQSTERRALLKEAERHGRELAAEAHTAMSGCGSMVLAGVSAARGEVEAAVTRLTRAAEIFEGAQMGLYAATARARKGLLVGGDQGRELVDGADRFMCRQGIRELGRMREMLAPGFAS